MANTAMYPQSGLKTQKGRIIQGVAVDFGVCKTVRTRVTTAQANAGYTLLPALPGVIWQLLPPTSLIAIGGAAATATSVNITGTRAGSAVQLAVVTVAALTRSTVITLGDVPAAGSVTLLADGASFTPLDPNTAVQLTVVTGNLATATAIDVIMSFTASMQS